MAHAEASARTVEAAVTAAAAQLGLRSDQVDVEVLEDPVPSTFGYIGTPARVRVTPRPPATSPPSDATRVSSPASPAGAQAVDQGQPASTIEAGAPAPPLSTAEVGVPGQPSDTTEVGVPAQPSHPTEPGAPGQPSHPTEADVPGRPSHSTPAPGPTGIPDPLPVSRSSSRAPSDAQDLNDANRTSGSYGSDLPEAPAASDSSPAGPEPLVTDSALGSYPAGSGSAETQGLSGSPPATQAPPTTTSSAGSGAPGAPDQSSAAPVPQAPSSTQDLEEGPAPERQQPSAQGGIEPGMAEEQATTAALGAEIDPTSSAVPERAAEQRPGSGPETGGGGSGSVAEGAMAASSGSSVVETASPPSSVSEPSSPTRSRRTFRDEPIEPEMVEADTERAGDFLEGLLDALDVDGDITTWVDEVGGHIDLEGSDLDVLVGSNGETLDALQELTRIAVLRQSKRRVRLLLDINGYRARHRDQLVAIVKATVERVLTSREDHEFEPMTPAERKVVHDAVAEMDGVHTESLGEEPYRRVIIRPT